MTGNVVEHLGIVIDYSRDNEIPEQGIAMLTGKGFYKKEWEESPQETFARASTAYSFGDYEFAQRIYEYSSKQWFAFASPVMSNAPEIQWPTFSESEFEDAGDWLEENVEADGLPISCFLPMIADSKQGLTKASDEAKHLSMMGGGVGVYAANRSPDEKSTGVMAHARDYDSMTLAYRQTATRRGSMAMYLDIDHPEIKSFLQMRNPIGGDSNKKCFNLNHAVNIPDSFMIKMIKGEDYELVDPKHGPTGRFLNAREVWEELLELRKETGEPYLIFKDTINRKLPKWITKPTYRVSQSNLCSEITLMTSFKRTAVCCLSSLNLEKYEEWKDTNIVADLIRLLDNVLEFFIRLAPPELNRAVYSASKERALGLGTLGWHSYLQSKMIPFESGGFNSAIQHTHLIYSDLQKKAIDESLRLGSLRGEAPDCVGSGMRNSHLFAVAPNASSSSIVGASPSIEPFNSNAFNAEGRAGSFLIRNKYLEDILIKHGQNTQAVWSSIITKEGSVQHLAFLSDLERAVFKTAYEINPMWIIEQASARQQYICQSQSVNLFVPATISKEEMSDIHVSAWVKGMKTLYYCRSKSATKANIGTGGSQPLNAVPVRTKIEYEGCLSCEG